jgi:hypothetical protein
MTDTAHIPDQTPRKLDLPDWRDTKPEIGYQGGQRDGGAMSAIGGSLRVRSRRLRGARAVDRHQSTSA